MYSMLRFPLAAQSLGKDAPAGLGALIWLNSFTIFILHVELGGFPAHLGTCSTGFCQKSRDGEANSRLANSLGRHF